MVTAGVAHFVLPDMFIPLVPPSLPWPREIVFASGALEILFGGMLLIARYARRAAWWLVALLIAVFPGNLHMAANAGSFPNLDISPTLLWLRLPLQALLISWAWMFTRRPPIVRHASARRTPVRSMRA